MAEKLSELPVKSDTQLNTQESSIMKKYFKKGNDDEEIPAKNEKTWSSTLKFIGYACLLFILVINPFTLSFIGMIPYCADNFIATMAVVLFLFALGIGILYRFF